MKRKVMTTIAIAFFLLSLTATSVRAEIVPYLDQTLTSNGVTHSGHFDDLWDLTASDMVISFTYDANGLLDDAGHAWAQLGVRTVGYGDFNPTWEAEGAGVWLATDYDWTANTFDPDVTPTLDLDDKLILSRAGNTGEGWYNLPSTPPAPGNNHRVWWDRDGVDPYQNSATANTGGIYAIVISLHATSATSGTAYMTVRSLAQGFETDGNWNTIELTPAGMTFTGNMQNLQVFYGLYGSGGSHSVEFRDITVTGSRVPIGNVVPEVPLGTVAVSVAMLIGLGAFMSRGKIGKIRKI